MASPVTPTVPTSMARMPYSGWISEAGIQRGLVKNSHHMQLAEDHRRRFAEDEEEDGEDENDGAVAAQPHGPFHKRLQPVGQRPPHAGRRRRASDHVRKKKPS